MHTVLRDLFAAQMLQTQAPPPSSQGQSDQQDMGMGPQMPDDVAAAPYVTLLTKLGYEYQNSDEDLTGQPIGNSFTGPDGDMIYIKPDGSWQRFGPGANRTSGKSAMDLGTSLVKDSLASGDDQNTHGALRKAGYNKMHTDKDGNTYYKHPQTGVSMHVRKDGSWGHSSGTGRGAKKMQDFLGNEQMNNQDPMVMQTKLKTQQMKQQSDMMKKQQKFGNVKPGTRGNTGTRGGAGMGGRGGF